MKFLNCYKELLGCSCEDDVFQCMLDNLKPSNNLWSYFVNWEKIYSNVKNIEINLNLLNYLIGKENFDEEFKALIKEQSQVVKILPALVVSREKKFNILIDYEHKKLVYEEYDFSIKNPTENDINKYLHFVKESGLRDLICSGKIKFLVDYMIGVEAGLDSNGRKSRSGASMGLIVECFIKDLCLKKGYRYISEANAQKIKKEFGYEIPAHKYSSKRYNYVIDTGSEPVLMEVNYYNCGGSKLSETAKAYREVETFLAKKYKFVWITDGQGWLESHNALRDTLAHNDYLLTLSMLEKGILEKFI